MRTTVVTSMQRPKTSWNRYDREAGFPGVMFISLSLENLKSKQIQTQNFSIVPKLVIKFKQSRQVLAKHHEKHSKSMLKVYGVPAHSKERKEEFEKDMNWKFPSWIDRKIHASIKNTRKHTVCHFIDQQLCIIIQCRQIQTKTLVQIDGFINFR